MSMKTEQCRPSGSATTQAIRDFILAGGRIIITPDGELTEGGGLPRAFTHGSVAEADEYLRAGRAYLVARTTHGGDARIMRAVRRLGRRTENGWLALGTSGASIRKRGLN
ncbi:hypothetical protein [Novosphingobium kaempferiae]|uniref:hypothetical protein n=1 Tax=Novosphingobium kaempferiae TaxID=2896849 RepID=UPI001E2D5FB2|nr:hypothetical protein [Novosphingobium kaempferiae]